MMFKIMKPHHQENVILGSIYYIKESREYITHSVEISVKILSSDTLSLLN